MKGQVYKIHSDFYYVETPAGVIEAKVRDVLKKQNTDIVVGDFVELEQVNHDTTQAFICKLMPRKNFIPRPKAANVDQVVIVASIKEPELEFEQLNRYLCFCDYYKIPPIICFNKNDLLDDENLVSLINKIYEPLGFETLFISALEQNGLSEIEAKLEGKISVLCGMSGVGKSTILNVIQPNLQLKTGAVSIKTSKGTHTTRHCEIVNIELSNGKTCRVVDTPGFSNLKFDFLLPAEISDLFSEIKKFKKNCKFKDCLHIGEEECNVTKNLHKINSSRYDSYRKFVDEADAYKKVVAKQGTKKESRSKIINNNEVAKINSKKRETNRKGLKQKLTSRFTGETDEY